MTLEELQTAANNGDMTAALTVADYYYGDGKDPDKEEAALPWYEKAGNLGSLKGAAVAMLIHASDANAYMMMGSYDSALKSWQAVNNWAVTVMQHNEADLNAKALGIEKFNYSVFEMGMCLFSQQDYAAAASILRHASTEDVKSQLLYGICLAQSNQVKAAVPLLSLVKTASKYRETIEKATADELVTFVNATLLLSRLFRQGSVDGQSNCDAAVDVLLTARAAFTSNAKVIAVLQRELSGYRKKLFGGYTYAG